MRGIFNVFIDHFVILWKYMNFWVDSFKRDLFHTSPIGFLVIWDSTLIWVGSTFVFLAALVDPRIHMIEYSIVHLFCLIMVICLKCLNRYSLVTKSSSYEMYYRRKRAQHRVIIIGEKDSIDFHNSYDLVYTDSPKMRQHFEKLGIPVENVSGALNHTADLILIGSDAQYLGHAEIKKQIRIT